MIKLRNSLIKYYKLHKARRTTQPTAIKKTTDLKSNSIAVLLKATKQVCFNLDLNRLHVCRCFSAGVLHRTHLRVSSPSISGAAVAGAQFTEGDQLQVKFVLQLSGLLSQICSSRMHRQKKLSTDSQQFVIKTGPMLLYFTQSKVMLICTSIKYRAE